MGSTSGERAAVRFDLIAAAARILAVDGPRGLTTRRLATEAGTSTMAVYTVFGSMDEVRRAVREEGFNRLAAALDTVLARPRPDSRREDQLADPVAELAVAGLVHLDTGLANPELYQAMFIDPPPHDDSDDPASGATYQDLVRGVDRAVAAGRFDPAEPGLTQLWAAQLWTAHHGAVTLVRTGLVPAAAARHLLTDMIYRLCLGYGDTAAAAHHSIERAISTTAPDRGGSTT